MSAVTLSGVSAHRHRRLVLEGVDATFASGRLTAVIGVNGAGKSTVLEVAAGLLVPSSGEVRLGDAPIAAIDRRTLARRRAYLPQSPRVDWPISVERVVALGLTAHLPAFGALPAHLMPRIERALFDHDLMALRDRPATRLSGGERTRVMLARATVGDPELLIVDEPTAGLDPRHAIDAAMRLRAMASAGRTVIAALHDLDIAMRIADDVIALRDGRVFASGAAGAVLTAGTLGALYDVPVSVHGEGAARTFRFGG